MSSASHHCLEWGYGHRQTLSGLRLPEDKHPSVIRTQCGKSLEVEGGQEYPEDHLTYGGVGRGTFWNISIRTKTGTPKVGGCLERKW